MLQLLRFEIQAFVHPSCCFVLSMACTPQKRMKVEKPSPVKLELCALQEPSIVPPVFVAAAAPLKREMKEELVAVVVEEVEFIGHSTLAAKLKIALDEGKSRKAAVQQVLVEENVTFRALQLHCAEQFPWVRGNIVGAFMETASKCSICSRFKCSTAAKLSAPWTFLKIIKVVLIFNILLHVNCRNWSSARCGFCLREMRPVRSIADLFADPEKLSSVKRLSYQAFYRACVEAGKGVQLREDFGRVVDVEVKPLELFSIS